jgi:hypothetical protein
MIFQIEKVGIFNFCKDDKEISSLSANTEFDRRVKLYLNDIYVQNNPHVLNNKHDGGFKYSCPYKNCHLKYDKNKFVQHMRRHVCLFLTFSMIFGHLIVQMVNARKVLSLKQI